MPQTFLTPIIIFVAVIFCFGVLFVGDFNLLVLGALIPPLLVSSTRTDLWAAAIIACHLSRIRVPGIPGQVQLYELLILGMVGLLVLKSLASHFTPKLTLTKFWAAAFLIVLVVLMAERGSGFQALGSDMWGGSGYVHLICGILFYLFADQVSLSPKTWRTAFIAMFALATLPSLSELIFNLSNGAARWHLLFLLPYETASVGLGDHAIARYQSLTILTPLFLLPFLLLPFTGQHRKWYFIATLLTIGLGGLSGHRMVIITIGLTIWIHIYFQVRNKVSYILVSVLLLSAGLLVIGQLAPLLPKAHQRMLSIIPFANVAQDVSTDAAGTVKWRISVWKEAIGMIPDYLWLGKGFAFSVDAHLSRAALFSEAYATRWAIVQTAFHQGVLSLLVGTGLAGFIAGTGFLLGMSLRHNQTKKKEWNNKQLQRMHNVMFSYFVSQAVIYVLVYGDVQVSFPQIFLHGGILEALRFSDKAVAPSAIETQAEPEPQMLAQHPSGQSHPRTLPAWSNNT
ncbi:MAG: hypothetical protein ACI9OU_002136 [Candidatus Promineifilaceae bacterium]|jgi:hypothetical protein